MLKEQDKIFLFKWFSSLFTVWYASVGLYLYDPYILQIIYWPLHTHDIEIDVVESTVDWQSYIDKLDRDLEKGFLYIDKTIEEIDNSEVEIIEDVIEIRKLDKEFLDRYGLEPQTVEELQQQRPSLETQLNKKLSLEEVYSLVGGELLSDETE